MQILVVGASGKTGQKLLKKLSHTSHKATGLIRSSSQESMVTQWKATPLLGDLENDLYPLLTNIDAIMFVAGSRGKNVQGIDYQGLANIVDAAVKASIKRFLYIGSINTKKEPAQYIQEFLDYYKNIDQPAPKEFLATVKKESYHDYLKMKAKAEDHIINSGLNYTILRAGLLTLEEGSGLVSTTKNTLNCFGKVARENVAECFIEALESEDTPHATYTILDGETPIKKAFS